jgi:hypothetical protein
MIERYNDWKKIGGRWVKVPTTRELPDEVPYGWKWKPTEYRHVESVQRYDGGLEELIWDSEKRLEADLCGLPAPERKEPVGWTGGLKDWFRKAEAQVDALEFEAPSKVEPVAQAVQPKGLDRLLKRLYSVLER